MYYIDIHSHRKNNDPDVISIHSLRVGVDTIDITEPYISAGIHPWDVKQCNQTDISFIINNIKHLAAIGEIGLDSYWGDEVIQKQWFEKQLEIAERFGKPVIIHSVKRHNEVIACLNNFSKLKAVIIHGFVGNKQEIMRYMDSGVYVSFGHRTLMSPKTRESLIYTPSDRLFYETDENCINIKELYQEMEKMSGRDCKNVIYENFEKIFKI